MKLGDAIASVATPIARALKLDCIDQETNELKPESPCAKAKRALNEGRYADAIYDRFWNKNKGEKMQFIIQVTVEADDIRQALDQVKGGNVISVNPRSLNPVARPAGNRTSPGVPPQNQHKVG